MMFKIYFYPTKARDTEPDFFFLEAETIEEIQEQNIKFFKQRGLNINAHYGWSQEIKEDI